MAGIRVLWGRAPGEQADHPTLRRVKVLIGSEPLWREYANGGDGYSCAVSVLEQLRGDLLTYIPGLAEWAVRRVDVCIDHWGYGWSREDLDRFACRQKVRSCDETKESKKEPDDVDQVRAVGRPSSATYYVGARNGASRMLAIYDKIAEAQHSGKLPWMEPIWRQNDWDGVAKVWRIEIRHGGEWLQGHGLKTIEDLPGCEYALWRDYVDNVKHTTASRTRLKRSPASQVWTRLRGAVRRAEQEAKRAGKTARWVWQPRPPSPGGDMKQLTDMGAGCMRKIRDAMFNDAVADVEDVRLIEFMREAVRQSDERARQRQAHLARMNPQRERPPPPTPEAS